MHAAGCTILPDNIIPARTSDAIAVRAVLDSRSPVLLVPFHAHNDTDGNRVDGLGFLAKLDAAKRRDFEWRVVMPVSAFAVPAVTTILARGELEPHIQQQILMITEDALRDPGTAMRIRAHVGA